MYNLNEKVITFLDPETIEQNTMDQIDNISKMPFIFKHVAVMPDCHLGKGATVGSVIATKGAIIPAAVGVDIGCGMIAVETTLIANHLPDTLKGLREGIERRIPLSAGGYNQTVHGSAQPRVDKLAAKSKGYYHQMTKTRWDYQLGSLGSGNHFIEVCLDELGAVWVVLHSGSRGIGNQLAQRHIKVAQKLMDLFFIPLVDRDLAYLPEDTPEFKEYIQDLLWAQDFALANREEMMDRVLKQLSLTVFGMEMQIERKRINCHHNFTQQEYHLGENVWITRKGAIQMREGQLGVIPGSMGTSSFIVSGLGNRLSYHSAPHGAGRRFSRREAKKRFTMEDFDRELKGIEVNRSEQFLDEIPSAYKDINLVMENSKELVKVEHTLKQILNVKGY